MAIPLPIAYIRQYAAALDADTVFATTADRDAYLISPRRYAGQLVVDIEKPGIYYLNATRDTWIPVTEGTTGNAILEINYIANDTPNHNFTVPIDTVVERIIVIPTSNITFAIGYNEGAKDVLPDGDITTDGQMVTLDVFTLSTQKTIYFSGITANTKIKFYLK